MKKLIYLAILLLSLSDITKAQNGYVTIVATVKDPTGALYVNSQVGATFQDPGTSGKLPLLYGSTFQTNLTGYGTDSFAHFSLSVADNQQIGASSGATGTSWRFTILYQDRATSFTYQSPIDCIDNIPVTCNSGVMDISAPLQAAAALLPNQSGGGAFVPITVSGSATPVFNSNSNTTFTYTLNQPVTASTFITVPKPNTTNIFQFNICQNSTGNYPMVWPANVTLPSNYSFNLNPNACSPVAFVYSPALNLWTPWEGAGSASGGIVNVAVPPTGVCVAGSTPQQVISTGTLYTCQAGVWGAVASPSGCTTSGNQGTVQASGASAGTCQPTNIVELSNGLTINEDIPASKGPNPYVDITSFGAVALNTSFTPYLPGITATATAGNPALSISAASTFVKGQGVQVIGAGPTNTMATPSAPVVTCVLAAGPTGTGIVVPCPAGGSETTCYTLTGIDKGYGITAASPETCVTGQTRGPQSNTLNNCVRSLNTLITCQTTAAHTLAPGAEIDIRNTTLDSEYGGSHVVVSTPDNTHFTYQFQRDTRTGASSVTATGGTVSYKQGNHIVIAGQSPPAGVWQYAIHRGSSGAETYVDLSGMVVSGNLDVWYMTWDDWGTSYTTASNRPFYIPNTPPNAAVNDSLITTICAGAGTTSLTLCLAPSNSTTSSTIVADNTANYLAAFTFAAANHGKVHVPAVASSNFATNSILDISPFNGTGLLISSDPYFGGTVLTNGNVIDGDTTFVSCTSFSLECLINITFNSAKPGIWGRNPVFRKLSLNPLGTNTQALFITGGVPTGILEDIALLGASAGNDFTSTPLRLLTQAQAGASAAGIVMNRIFTKGVSQGTTPLIISNNYGEVNIDTLMGAGRGFAFLNCPTCTITGVSVTQKLENQAASMSLFTTRGTVGLNVIGIIEDTGAQPIVTHLGQGFLQLGISASTPSSGIPQITGTSILVTNGLNPGPQQGVNTSYVAQGNGLINDGTYNSNQGLQQFYMQTDLGPGYSFFTDPSIGGPIAAPTCAVITAGPPFPSAGAHSFSYSAIYPNGGQSLVSPISNSCTVDGATQQINISIPALVSDASYNWYFDGNNLPEVNGVSCVHTTPAGTLTWTWQGQTCGFNSQPNLAGGGLAGVKNNFLWSDIYLLGKYADIFETPTPANPTSGFERWFANSATHQLSCILPSGASCVNTGIGTGTQNCLTDWPTTSSLGSVCSSIAGQVPVANNGSAPSFLSPSMVDSPNSPVSTTPYLIACDTSSSIIDRTKTIRFQSGASAITIPLSSATGCNGLVTTIFDDGAGTLTLTRSGSDTITIVNGSTNLDAQTSFTLTNGQYVTLSQNATGLWLARIAIGASAGVSSFSGDGALLCNSASAGAVTASICGSTGAHKYWGNPSGVAGAAGFNSLVVADLPTNIPNANLANPSTTVNTQTCTLGSSCTITYANIPAGAIANTTTATTQSAGDSTTDVATDAFVTTAVNNAIAAVNPAVAVLAATTGSNLTGTYSNGASGIGATFTITTTGAFTLDGIAINTVGQRVLLKDQTSAFQNGVYTATVVGATGISPVFTRALDYDQPSDINTTGAIPVQSGTVNASTSWLLTSTVNTIGTDALTYVQFTIAPSNIATKIASGTAAMGTSAITSGSCATVVTVSATGVLTTDILTTSFNGDPTAITGYGASATGAVLTIYPYPTANNVNFKVCNSTASSITPSPLTLNWKVVR